MDTNSFSLLGVQQVIDSVLATFVACDAHTIKSEEQSRNNRILLSGLTLLLPEFV